MVDVVYTDDRASMYFMHDLSEEKMYDGDKLKLFDFVCLVYNYVYMIVYGGISERSG